MYVLYKEFAERLPIQLICSHFNDCQLEHGNIITQGIPSLFSVSKIFHFLMTPIDSRNDQNKWVELFKAAFTH